MWVGVVIGCAVGVEEDNDDDDDDDDDDEVVVVEEEEVVVVEEDDTLSLLVTLKYCDLNRGPRLSFEALYIPSQKMLLRLIFCAGLPSQA